MTCTNSKASQNAPWNTEVMLSVFCMQRNRWNNLLKAMTSMPVWVEEREYLTPGPVLESIKSGFWSSVCNCGGSFCWCWLGFVFFPQTILFYVFAVSNANCIPDIAVASLILQNWVSSISSHLNIWLIPSTSFSGMLYCLQHQQLRELAFSLTQCFGTGAEVVTLKFWWRRNNQGGIKASCFLW